MVLARLQNNSSGSIAENKGTRMAARPVKFPPCEIQCNNITSPA
jgi:hypothetical protein